MSPAEAVVMPAVPVEGALVWRVVLGKLVGLKEGAGEVEGRWEGAGVGAWFVGASVRAGFEGRAVFEADEDRGAMEVGDEVRSRGARLGAEDVTPACPKVLTVGRRVGKRLGTPGLVPQ